MNKEQKFLLSLPYETRSRYRLKLIISSINWSRYPHNVQTPYCHVLLNDNKIIIDIFFCVLLTLLSFLFALSQKGNFLKRNICSVILLINKKSYVETKDMNVIKHVFINNIVFANSVCFQYNNVVFPIVNDSTFNQYIMQIENRR